MGLEFKPLLVWVGLEVWAFAFYVVYSAHARILGLGVHAIRESVVSWCGHGSACDCGACASMRDRKKDPWLAL